MKGEFTTTIWWPSDEQDLGPRKQSKRGIRTECVLSHTASGGFEFEVVMLATVSWPHTRLWDWIKKFRPKKSNIKFGGNALNTSSRKFSDGENLKLSGVRDRPKLSSVSLYNSLGVRPNFSPQNFSSFDPTQFVRLGMEESQSSSTAGFVVPLTVIWKEELLREHIESRKYDRRSSLKNTGISRIGGKKTRFEGKPQC